MLNTRLIINIHREQEGEKKRDRECYEQLEVEIFLLKKI